MYKNLSGVLSTSIYEATVKYWAASEAYGKNFTAITD